MNKKHLAVHASMLAVIGVLAGFLAAEVNKHPSIQNAVDKEALIIRRLGFGCGVERWSVKTLADVNATKVIFSPVVSTNIAKLDALPTDHPTVREAPTETTTWQLSSTHIIAFKLEADSDIHLELRSVLPGNPTMIAELPLPSCVSANSDPIIHAQQLRIGTARAAFLNYIQSKGLQLQTYYQHVDWTVFLQGVGFFDFNHGQTGVAPNAIELHPVLYFHGS